MRVFECTECHKKMYAPKGCAIKTSRGHMKKRFCPYCYCDQDFIQVDTK